ncbi:SDR family NAD(P)-dependent oxidoreductase [Paenarthrobacter sp. YAF11_1]
MAEEIRNEQTEKTDLDEDIAMALVNNVVSTSYDPCFRPRRCRCRVHLPQYRAVRQDLKTNVYALFWLTKAALPHLQPGAAIINTSSIQGYHPSPSLMDYAATKAAINSMTFSLAESLGPKGIRA